MRIAILEDNAGMIRMLEISFKKTDHEVHAFQTAKAFLDFFATSGNVDIIIVDFYLMTERGKSSLSGADVIRHIREEHPSMPAILISAAPMFELEDAVRDITGVVIMQKVFKMSSLMQTIDALST